MPMLQVAKSLSILQFPLVASIHTFYPASSLEFHKKLEAVSHHIFLTEVRFAIKHSMRYVVS